METCPHCGAPGAFDQASDGRCPVCGMALPDDVDQGDAAAAAQQQADASEGSAEPDARTLMPSAATPGEAATIALAGGDDGEDGDDEGPSGAELIQPRELSPEYARRVTAAWKQTRDKAHDVRDTVKTEHADGAKIGDLHVGDRSVGPVEDGGEMDYELQEVIGEGAMGSVWSARQTSLDRDVAIKIPKGFAASSSAGRQQFMSEVVVTGQLDHPNIVPIYELGKDASGQLFYSMKRVDGRPWNELLEENARSQAENLEILLKACDAIRFAHDRGVIHRDIKPHNIMVGQYGEVAVMDWGIALRVDANAPEAGINTRISPAGTPAYMAPEMATGNASDIGPATDVYLLGAVLYEILTGEPPHPPPYDSKDHKQLLTDALLIAARNEIPPIQTPGELADVAYRALATKVENRYQNVREFQDGIRDFLAHAESINLTERGEVLLENAKRNGKASRGDQGSRFDEFDRARFAFEEALQIWPANKTARTRHAETLLAYARFAYDEGAYARGIALLSNDNPDHKSLLRKLKAARKRTDRLSWLLKGAILLILVGGSIFSFFLYHARNQAVRARNDAIEARDDAVQSQKAEEEAKNDALVARDDALRAQRAEEAAKNDAIDARNDALAAQQAEEAAKNDAISARNDAVDAQKAEEQAKNEAIAAEREAQRSSYASEIGLAAEELQRNAFDRVASILDSQADDQAKRELMNWEWGHLRALVSLDAESFDDGGNPLQGRIEATSVSKNGEWIAVGTGNGDVYVWRSDQSEQPVQLKYGDAVNGVAITDDGSTLVAAGRSDGNAHSIKTWQLPARKNAPPSATLATHDAPILSLDLAGDADMLLAAGADGRVSLHDLGGGDPVTFPATSQENEIWSARFSRGGKWIVTAGEDGTVRVWNTETVRRDKNAAREVRRFEGHEGPIYTAAFAPDASYVVSGGRDRRLLAMPFDATADQKPYSPRDAVRRRLADPANTQLRSDALTLGEHDAAIRSVSFSQDGQVLFSGGHDHTVRVWDVADGADQARRLKTIRGHGGWVRSCVGLPTDSDSVVSGGYDRRLRVWNWRSYAFPQVLRHSSQRTIGDLKLTAGAVSADSQWVASAAANGVITVWDMSDPLDPQSQELAEGHDWQATTAAYLRDDQWLLTAGGDNTTLVWDAERGNEVARIGGWNAPRGSGWRGVAAASADGKWIATGADGKTLLRIWDPAACPPGSRNCQPLAEIFTPQADAWAEEERPEATALAFSPEGKWLLGGDQWGNCYLAEVGEAWRMTSMQAHEGKISAVKFLPDADQFLTAGADGLVIRWAINQGQAVQLSELRHDDRVIAMDLASDGRTLITAVGSDDEQAVLRVWDLTDSERPAYKLTLAEVTGKTTVDDEKKSIVRSVALHPQRPQALITIFDRQTSTYHIGRWTWTNNDQPYRLVTAQGLRDLSTAMFAPRGEQMLTVGGRGARLRALGVHASQIAMTYRPQADIRSISFSADASQLVSASADGSLKIWRLEPEQRQWTPAAKLIGEHRGAIHRAVFHPARPEVFLTAGDDGAAKLWELRDQQWQVVRTLRSPQRSEAPLVDAAFLPGEPTRIVTAGIDAVYLWDEAGNAPEMIETPGVICCVAPSPDGRWIAVANGSTTQIYEVADLTLAGSLAGHSAEVTALEFTPDGARLFTTSRDWTVKLWDARTAVDGPGDGAAQRELLTLAGHADEVTSVTVAGGSDQPFVLTTGLDGQAIVWPHQSDRD